jgi:hypothetical protein
MLGELTGKERTQSEFKDLLGRTGFRLDRVIETGFNTFLLESSVALLISVVRRTESKISGPMP